MTQADAINWAMGEILKTPAKTPALEQSDTPRMDALTARMATELGKPMLQANHFIELCDFARQLERELAAAQGRRNEYAKHNLLGGPASVFRAMASRIEAGEEYYSVLEDYGFQVADHATPDRNAIIEQLRSHVWHLLKHYVFDRGQEAYTFWDGDQWLKNAAPQVSTAVTAPAGESGWAAAAAPKLSEARRLENAIVAARLDAFEAADMLGAIIASLEARYGEDAKALDDVRHYSKRFEDAIMELDK